MFITGVNNTGDKLFSVSTTPANNPCPGFLVITVFFYTGDKFITGVNDTGDKLFSGVNVTGEKFIAGVVDTGD